MAQVPNYWPTLSCFRLVAPLKAHSASKNIEGSSPMEHGAKGVMEGRVIKVRCQKSKF